MSPAFDVAAVVCGVAWSVVTYGELEEARKRRIAARLRPAVRRRLNLTEIGSALLTGRARVPVRIAAGALVGLLALGFGANIVLALVLAFLGGSAPTSLRRYFAERRRHAAERQVASYLSAVTMAYMTGGSIPRAAQAAARTFPAPLGEWLRMGVARVVNRQGDTIGDELWTLGRVEGIRTLMRLGNIVRRAQDGSGYEETIEALQTLDREMHEDERQRRAHKVAAKQGVMSVQFGSVGLGLFYVMLSASGDGKILTHETIGLVCTAAAAALVGMAYAISTFGNRSGLTEPKEGAR